MHPNPTLCNRPGPVGDRSNGATAPIPRHAGIMHQDCIFGPLCMIDRVGEALIAAIPRNPCADNVRYHDNGAGSAVSRPRPCRRRRRRTRRSSERPSARPPPEGGRGVRVRICIDNYIRCVFKSGFVDRGSTFLYMHATCGQHSYLMTPRRCWGVF